MTKYVYVVKVDGPEFNIIVAFCTTFKKAMNIAQKYKQWIIEEWPMNKGDLLSFNRREAWYCAIRVGDKVIQPGTLIGPYDGKITTQKRR